jgi:hypothetical protein
MVEGTAIDRAVENAGRKAVERHARAGSSLPTWDGAKVVWVPAAKVLPNYVKPRTQAAAHKQ